MSAQPDSFIRDLAPSDLGLDGGRFQEFRSVQYEALEWAIEVLERKRFAGLALPTGAGKSLFAAALIRLLGRRAVVLTATKALQEQYAGSFQSAGFVDIRGKANYDCQDLASLNCKDGARAGCRFLKGSGASGCTYDVRKLMARNAAAVVTNYDFWMAVNAASKGGGSAGLERTEKEASWKGGNPIELLVLDEAHEAADKLSSFVSVTLYESEMVRRLLDWPRSDDVGEWRRYAIDVGLQLEIDVAAKEQEVALAGRRVKKAQIDELHRLEALKIKIEKIAGIESGSDGEWICEMEVGGRYGRTWRFDPVFPGKYAERYLFCGVRSVVMMSATLKPKTMAMLGVGKEKFEFRGWRRIFPAHRQPIYQVGLRRENEKGAMRTLGLNYKTPKEDVAALVRWMDREIIAPRLDRKGLIATVSYERAEIIMAVSEYAALMIGNDGEPDSETAWEVAERFRKEPPPKILVSPSFSTGWDFPGEQLEYIVLFKVPIEPGKSKVAKARGKDHGAYKAMQAIEQTAGRGMRFAGDQCEVFLIDGRFGWFLAPPPIGYGNLAQDWFVQAVRKVDKVPVPLPKLRIEK